MSHVYNFYSRSSIKYWIFKKLDNWLQKCTQHCWQLKLKHSTLLNLDFMHIHVTQFMSHLMHKLQSFSLDFNWFHIIFLTCS
jgi:hypothetical protein